MGGTATKETCCADRRAVSRTTLASRTLPAATSARPIPTHVGEMPMRIVRIMNPFRAGESRHDGE
jgi:hypothetical protein